MMPKLITVSLAALLVACQGTDESEQAPLQTVPSVDLQRYQGRWYEVAKIPNRFQDHCASDTTAEYAQREDGRIRVLNRCVDKQGRIDEADGVARIVDPASNARLEVSFLDVLGLNLFWGDYWIIGLGQHYDYAVIGTPSRKFGWVLSRTPQLAPEKLAQVDQILRAQGYDPSAFERSTHAGHQ